MKHTPGPWKAVIANYSEDNLSWLACADVVTPRGATLVRFEGTQDYQKNDEHEANARLIAAAPEMAECLEEIVHQLLMDDMSGYGDEQAAAIKAASDLIERLRKGGAK